MTHCSSIGIDVGGSAKGFHAVALQDAEILGKFKSRSAVEVPAWCVELNADVVAVDAPCFWRGEGRPARAAERQLARVRISSFSTPTEATARGHAFFEWMFGGMEMFRALDASHPLYVGPPNPTAVAIETFPQAVACALAGEVVSAKKKNSARRNLLAQAGINETVLTNIDELDATLCALAAQAFARGTFHAYGDSAGGFIITPEWSPLPPSAPRRSHPASLPHSGELAKIVTALPLLSPVERKWLRDHLATT